MFFFNKTGGFIIRHLKYYNIDTFLRLLPYCATKMQIYNISRRNDLIFRQINGIIITVYCRLYVPNINTMRLFYDAIIH